jgi:hypothetical protein
MEDRGRRSEAIRSMGPDHPDTLVASATFVIRWAGPNSRR